MRSTSPCRGVHGAEGTNNVLLDRLGVRVVLLLVVRRAAVLRSDDKTTPRLGGDAVDEAEREDTCEEGERKRRHAPGTTTARQGRRSSVHDSAGVVVGAGILGVRVLGKTTSRGASSVQSPKG